MTATPAPDRGRPVGPLRARARTAVRASRKLARRLVPKPQLDGLPEELVLQRRAQLMRRRQFGRGELDKLEAFFASAEKVEGWGHWLLHGAPRDRRVIGLRHDMDNDVETAVAFAEWEAERGVQATYFVLHGDWYFRRAGRRFGFRPDASRFVLRRLDRIAELGHEIGLHNNALALALRTGEDPVKILERDLGALRRHGFTINGSVAHGDRLCRVAGFNNDEIFLDTPRPEFGPPQRRITLDDPELGRRTVDLRPVPMADLGLRYEANHRPEAMEISDSGGHWHGSFEDVARRFAAGSSTCLALVHPCWWALLPGELEPADKGVDVSRGPDARDGR
jgi:hypothetical protein